MKLNIIEDQDKGFLGGISFLIKITLILSDEEKTNIDKYKFKNNILIESEHNKSITVGNLITGYIEKASEISQLLELEQKFIEATKLFQRYYIEAIKFIGDEIVDCSIDSHENESVKLHISKVQSEKVFGGMNFYINCKASLSEVKLQLINNYKLGNLNLFTINNQSYRVSNIIDGVNFNGSIPQLNTIRDKIIDSCKTLDWYLTAMSSFGGETKTKLNNSVTIVASRDQKKGLFGSTTFFLKMKVELDEETNELINKYRLKPYILYKSENKTILVRNIIDGINESCKDVVVLIQNEEIYKNSIDLLKKYIDLIKNFGGSIEINLMDK